jgi:hypothetical protein
MKMITFTSKKVPKSLAKSFFYCVCCVDGGDAVDDHGGCARAIRCE